MEIAVVHQPRFKVIVADGQTISCETIFDVVQAVRAQATMADEGDSTLSLSFDYRIAVIDRSRIIEGVNEAVDATVKTDGE